MTKKLSLFSFLWVFLFSSNVLFAQSNYLNHLIEEETSAFANKSLLSRTTDVDSTISSALSRYQILDLDLSALATMKAEDHKAVRFEVPLSSGSSLFLKLITQKELTDNFKVFAGTKSSKIEVAYDKGLYYSGIIEGMPNSVATLSVFNGELMAVFSTLDGNYVLGKIESGPLRGKYIAYNDKDFLASNPIECHSNELAIPSIPATPAALMPSWASSCNAERIYFECDYNMYTSKGSSVTNVINYVTGMFNQVATLYQNDSMILQISEIFVWTSLDPYRFGSSFDALHDFTDSIQDAFNGDVAHLLSTRPAGNGGLAWLDVFCDSYYAPIHFGRTAYSNISTSYSTVPTYSWTVEVVAHENGHNVGSHHTHWCGWPGGAIDNCAAVESGPCTSGGIPAGGGTIMSYCHLTAAGINFNNGFGPLPGALLRDKFATTVCLQTACICMEYPSLGNDTTVCDSYSLDAGNGFSAYLWSTGATSQTLNVTASGSYWVRRDTLDCSGYDTINVTIVSASSSNIYDTICANDSILFAGLFRHLAGVYTDTLVNVFGCDSLYNLHLTQLPIYNTFDTTLICSGDSAFLGGAWRYVAGTYSQTHAAVNGCDSTHGSVLNLYFPASINDTLIICSGDSAFLGGAWRSSFGTYNDTAVGLAGCDSITATTLVLMLPTIDSVIEEICNTDSLFLGGAYRYTSGVYGDSLVSSIGCDSFVYTNLIVHPTFYFSVNAQICSGDSVFLAGAWQNSPGIFHDTFASNYGCDSAITTTLSVHPIFSISDTFHICPGDTLTFSTTFASAAGTYTDSLSTVYGCDSVRTHYVYMKSTSGGSRNISICSGDSILLGGAYRTVAGSYIDTLINYQFCDSFLTSNLSLLPVYSMNIYDSICSGESLIIAGISRTSAGIYFDSLSSSFGCDSVVAHHLSVMPVYNQDDSIGVCIGDSAQINGVWRSAVGIYHDTLNSLYGCDSIINTYLYHFPSYTTPVSMSICYGDSILLGGLYRSSVGTFYDTLSSSLMCDSIIASSLSIRPIDSTSGSIEICDGDSLLIGSTFRTITGDYPVTYSGSDGCDSVHITSLIVRPNYFTSDSVYICNGDSLLIGGLYRATPGTYPFVLSTVYGCDSLISRSLFVNPTYNLYDTAHICLGDSLFIGGTYRSATGNYIDIYSSSMGCDSIWHTRLVVHSPTTTLFNDTICEGDSIIIYGMVRFLAGVYKDTISSIYGCDSVLSTLLYIKPDAYSYQNLFACSGDSVWVVDEFLSVAGIYTDTFVSFNGCDSFLVTELSLYSLPSITLSNDTFICYGNSVVLTASGGVSYAWSTATIGSSITVTPYLTTNYTVIVTDSNSCRNTGDVLITVNPEILVTDSIIHVLCYGENTGSIHLSASGGSGSFSYNYGFGATASSAAFGLIAGNYNVTVTDNNGCSLGLLSVITQPSELITDLVKRDVACLVVNGDATVNASGGAPPYSYSWSSGGTFSSEAPLPEGSYSVTTTDFNGCSVIDVFSIDDVGGPTSTVITPTHPSFVGATDGAADLTIIGGTPPFTYEWSNGETSEDLTGLTDGVYYVTITDQNGCVIYNHVTLGWPQGIDELNQSSFVFNIYPNPSSGVFNYLIESSSGNSLKNTVLLVYNTSGQLIKNINFSSLGSDFRLSGYINLDKLSDGVYYFNLITEEAYLSRKVYLIKQ